MEKNKKTIVAFIYDFDKTLCTTDMQNYSFIPSLKIPASDFWKKTNDLSTKEHMDPLLAYMYIMIEESKKKNLPITREEFVKMGQNIQFFPGVTSWFNRLREYGKEKGVEVVHYVISSGNKEIIEGSKIYPMLDQVFACEYYYKDGQAVWPKSVVNYTTKTQFLYRINKGILDLAEHDKLNSSMKDADKPVPFQNMVYIADGLTDVPCMKTIRSFGGTSIAVYDKKIAPAKKLLTDGRVDFYLEADYSKGKMLDVVAKNIIDKVAPMDKLYHLHCTQMEDENE